MGKQDGFAPEELLVSPPINVPSHPTSDHASCTLQLPSDSENERNKINKWEMEHI